MPFDGADFIPGRSLQKLNAVANLVGTPGTWCKGTLRTGDGRYCLRGAILAVHADGLLEAPLLQAVHEVTGRHFRRIEAFNDHPYTDHALVCAVLQRTRDNLLAGRIAPEAGPDAGQVVHRPGVRRWRDTVRSWFAFG